MDTVPSPEESSPAGTHRAPLLGLSYIAGAFSGSSSMFRDLRQRPGAAWVAPMVFCALLTTAAAWISLPQVLEATYASAQAMMERMGVPEAEMEDALGEMRLVPDRTTLVRNVLVNLAVTPVLMIIGAAFVHLVGRMLGSRSRFSPTLGMFCVAYVVWALGGLVRGLVVAASDTVEVTLGPGALIPAIPVMSPLGIFLDLFDVFSIWHLVVLVAGISVVARVSRGTAWGVGGTYWVVRSLLLSVGKAFMLWTRGG